MINERQHHAQYTRTRSPSPTFTQTILTNEFGLLSISLPAAPIRHHRTPLPHAIRRIANTPTFSTTDPSLTTFLRFPPEIRIKVYRLLLQYDYVIKCGICPVKQRLVGHKNRYSQTPPWITHGLFPSILECCRITNREGSVVLYGENWFEIERWKSDYPVFETWGLGRRNLDSITMLSFGSVSWDKCAQDRKVLEKLDLFLGIREVDIYLADLSAEGWEAFLAEASGKLERIGKVTLQINISLRAGTKIYESQRRAPQDTIEDMCLRAYQPPFRKRESVWKNRSVRWEFAGYMCDFARSYCTGDLQVVLE
jgi:hypothetical protein